MPRPNTRTRILLTSLQLFNEHGEPNTSTNDIADETDISPGNLHYHFRKKADLINALLAEFQADARKLLALPDDERDAINAFWDFVHLLLETLAAYRFLFRDTETLIESYPQVARALRGFSRGLAAAIEIHVRSLRENGALQCNDKDIPSICRNLAIVALFSERYDSVSGSTAAVDVAALRVARSMLSILLPYSATETAPLLQALAEQYRK